MRRALVTGLLFALGSSGLPGCFYTDPVNQRPQLDIRPDSSQSVFRQDPILLHGIAADPEKHSVSFLWSVYACASATPPLACDDQPFYTGTGPDATFIVPAYRAAAGEVNHAMRVVLDGTDDLGATADPPQELVIPVLNHPPDLALRKETTHGAVVMTPINFYARYGDPDDTFENVTLEWTARSPAQMTVPMTDIEVGSIPGDPDHYQAGKQLLPNVVGDWTIDVAAVDKAGDRVTQSLQVRVLDDAPPCLETWLPIAPTGGAQYPLTEPTLFQVAVVRDDLDVYPPLPSDPFLGTTRFEWSLKLGAGPRQALATTANSVAIDPAVHTPGTTLELRVHIFDRKNVAIGCADADQTCAVVGSQPDCIQRQTWRVEVR